MRTVLQVQSEINDLTNKCVIITEIIGKMEDTPEIREYMNRTFEIDTPQLRGIASTLYSMSAILSEKLNNLKVDM